MARNRASSKSEMARLISAISKGSFVLFAWISDATSQLLRAMPMLQIIKLATTSAKDMFLKLDSQAMGFLFLAVGLKQQAQCDGFENSFA